MIIPTCINIIITKNNNNIKLFFVWPSILYKYFILLYFFDSFSIMNLNHFWQSPAWTAFLLSMSVHLHDLSVHMSTSKFLSIFMLTMDVHVRPCKALISSIQKILLLTNNNIQWNQLSANSYYLNENVIL